mmetsp:Transcript_16059/g.27087  ORF Transcript_16059/g.27087 Transcript_16059/m.27087 type:complete len:137 (+) Transcript_16059:47-457(+)
MTKMEASTAELGRGAFKLTTLFFAAIIIALLSSGGEVAAQRERGGEQQNLFVREKSENKTLVLVDTWATLETHSIFFDHIRSMGAGNHTLEFKLISGSSTDEVNIQQFNKYFYDNIIFMAPTVKSFGQDLKNSDIL